jgi:glutathione S-transferase
MSSEWIGISDARPRSGLRLVLTKGFPSPWSVAARWMFDLKGVHYTKVERTEDDLRHNALFEWTGQDSMPAAMLDDERPRTHWYSIALLTDRLGSEPRMVPAGAAERAAMAGLGNELLGELGLLWCLRVLMLLKRRESAPDDPIVNAMLAKYGSDPAGVEAAPARVRAILDLFAERMRTQAGRGSEFLVGDTASALDFYWSAASVLLAPLDTFGLPERALGFAHACAAVAGVIDPALIALRDRMFARHYALPLDLL